MPVPVQEEIVESLEGRVGQTLIVTVKDVGEIEGILGGFDESRNIVLNEAQNLTTGEILKTLIIRGIFISSIRSLQS